MDKNDLIGGSVFGVVMRLIVLSLVVGIVLSALGITPANLFRSIDVLIRRLYDLGFGAIDWVLQYILVGAMVVVPIWLIARLASGLKARKD